MSPTPRPGEIGFVPSPTRLAIYFPEPATQGGLRVKAVLPLVLISVAAYGQPAPAANPRATPADRDAGAKIFRSHCASCHGRNGQGGLGPILTTGVFYHGSTDADLYRNISEGITGTAM